MVKIREFEIDNQEYYEVFSIEDKKISGFGKTVEDAITDYAKTLEEYLNSLCILE